MFLGRVLALKPCLVATAFTSRHQPINLHKVNTNILLFHFQYTLHSSNLFTTVFVRFFRSSSSSRCVQAFPLKHCYDDLTLRKRGVSHEVSEHAQEWPGSWEPGPRGNRPLVHPCEQRRMLHLAHSQVPAQGNTTCFLCVRRMLRDLPPRHSFPLK